MYLALNFIFEMVYFRSYWSHLDISTTICSHQMAVVGFEFTTLRFRGLVPTHCAIGADVSCPESSVAELG